MIQQCDRCGYYYEGEGAVCPQCGWDNVNGMDIAADDELPEEEK